MHGIFVLIYVIFCRYVDQETTKWKSECGCEDEAEGVQGKVQYSTVQWSRSETTQIESQINTRSLMCGCNQTANCCMLFGWQLISSDSSLASFSVCTFSLCISRLCLQCFLLFFSNYRRSSRLPIFLCMLYLILFSYNFSPCGFV